MDIQTLPLAQPAFKIEQKIVSVHVYIPTINSELAEQAKDGWQALSMVLHGDHLLILVQRVATTN